MEPLKIGIVLNFKAAEKKKDEILNVNSTKKPWLKLAKNKEFTPFTIMREKKRCVPVDVALGVYIQDKYPTIKIDYIKPEEISSKRFAQNDIVFLMQYDLLEAFHLTDHSKFKIFQKTLETSKNVYPPYEYQKFINNKCIYYAFLKKKGIPVAPTQCIFDSTGFNKNPEKYMEDLLTKIIWNSFIIKPVYGQESYGFEKFLDRKQNPKVLKTKLRNYLKKYVPKYKNIIVQKYIPGFDKKNMEARLYYINGKYLFAMITSGLTHTTAMREARPIQEGGTFRIPDSNWKYVKELGNRVMNILPKFDLPPGMQNSIITRIDVGSGLPDAPFTYFVNEVEFVPAFFIEEHNEPVIQNIGDALVKLAEVYHNRKTAVKVDFA